MSRPTLAPSSRYAVDTALLARLTARIVAGPGAPLRDTVTPMTGEVIARVPQSSPADVVIAVESARAAQRSWAATSAARRTRIMLRLHDLVLARQDALLDLIQLESGKARAHAFEEVADVALVSRHYARRAAAYLTPKRAAGILPLLTRAVTSYHPVGVVGLVTPWNYPLTLPVCDAIPALMAGNAVVLRPDPQTALTALHGAALLAEAGLPEGVLQVVVGDGPTVGQAVVEHADYVCYTGSTPTGRSVGRTAAARIVGSSLELGGKNSLYVRPDADLSRAVEGAVRSCFGSAGQLCVHTERLVLHEEVADDFLAGFVPAVVAMRLGPQLAYGIEMGSLLGPAQLERTRSHVEDALANGARLLAGGRARPDLGPFFHEPTVLGGVTTAMRCRDEETFGPLVAVYRVGSDEEAVALANDTAYGLNASIWTRDVPAGRRIAAQIKAGTVNINEGYAAAWSATGAPMGGMRDSGIGRRHGPGGDPQVHREPERRRPARDRARHATRPQRRAVERGHDGGAAAVQGGGPPVSEWDVDVVVVGSGFGGSVSALRLAEKGYSVLVYEAGRRFADADFARTSWDVRRYLWAPALKCFGVQRIHRLRDVMILAGAGVGRRLAELREHALRPAAPVLRGPAVGAHHRLAGRARAALRDRVPDAGRRHELLRRAGRTGDALCGNGSRRGGDLPAYPGRGLPRRAGRHGARSVLRRRRPAAHRLHRVRQLHGRLPRRRQEHPRRRTTCGWPNGAARGSSRCARSSTSARSTPSGREAGYAVTTRATGAWLRRDRHTVTAGQVVVAAGAWGTQQLLHRMKASSLPLLSERLGELTRTNSEALGGASLVRVPDGVDLTRGLAITTSFHVDEVTHVENCRYGKGLEPARAAGHAHGRRRGATAAAGAVPVGQVARHPRDFGRTLWVRGWSERTVVALVMQSVDNALTVRGRRGLLGRFRLTSTQGHGEPEPELVPAGQRRGAGHVRGAHPAYRRAGGAGRERLGRRRHAAHRALPRRVLDLGLGRRRASSTRTTGCGATPACPSSTGRPCRPTSGSTRR